MAKAKKLPSGSWRCQVYSYTDTEGKRHYESFTADTKKEAEYLAAQFVMNKDTHKRPDNINIGTAVQQYIEIKSNVLSPSTIRGYQGLYRNYYNSIKDIKLRELKTEAIQSWIGTITQGHSPKTVRNAMGLLSAALDMFLPDTNFKVSLPPKKKPELYVPSDDDVKRLLLYIEGKELELAVLLAAFGPMRRGEICALESSDIQGNLVSVNKSMVQTPDKTWEIKTPKTYSSYRIIEFPQFVIDKLQEIEGRIIKATPAQITNRFSRAIKYAKLPHFRFHDLRHYSASIMHAIGVPDQYIMQRGGWASDAILKGVYRNTIDDQTKKFTNVINGHFDNMQHEIQHEN